MKLAGLIKRQQMVQRASRLENQLTIELENYAIASLVDVAIDLTSGHYVGSVCGIRVVRYLLSEKLTLDIRALSNDRGRMFVLDKIEWTGSVCLMAGARVAAYLR